jgi:hypothetical protein
MRWCAGSATAVSGCVASRPVFEIGNRKSEIGNLESPMSSMLLENLLDWVVPDRDHCIKAAADLAARRPDLSPEALAREAVASARTWAAGAGAATGVAANPLIALPAALADMAAVLHIEGTMAGTIAALLDPASLTDPAKFQADVLAVVFPGAVSQALRQLGVRWGQRITKQLIRRYLTEGLIKNVTRFSSRYLFVHITEKAIVSKTVPLVGAGIGAGWNWLEVKAVGMRAMRYYQNKGISPHGPGGQKFGRIRSVASRVVPRRRPKLGPPDDHGKA